MTVSLSDATSEITFDELHLSAPLLAAIKGSGYETPTPIQAATIPFLLAGRDVLGQAQTGTGKTAAFAVPMLERIDLDQKVPQVLVLTPTRELAIQVAEAFERYAAGLRGLKVAAIYGGQGYEIQLRQLDRGVHVVVGTPGRVMDHIRRGALELHGLRGLVLDEADEMLKMGFADDVEWVLTQAPAERQIALFSATMPPAIRRIAQKHLRNPEEITIQQRAATADTVRQRFIVAASYQKEAVLARILETEPIDGVLVFVKAKSTTEPLAQYLAERGHRTAALSSDVAQAQRVQIVEGLRAGRIDVIIATDVAARGLDVQRISHVINYDMPFDSQGYVHRIGRTGRAGRSGNAILFMHPRDRQLLRRLEQSTRQNIEPMEIPSVDEINKRRVARFFDRITEGLARKDLATFASMIEEYRSEKDVPIETMAAALAAMASGEAPLMQTEELKQSYFVGERDSMNGPRSRPGQRSFGERAGGSRNFAEQESRPRIPNEQMETYRIEIGRAHQIKPANIVGVITNETGLQGNGIGRIEIFDEHCTVDLLAGMPAEMLQTLKRVKVMGRALNISRTESAPPRADRPFRKFKPKSKRAVAKS